MAQHDVRDLGLGAAGQNVAGGFNAQVANYIPPLPHVGLPHGYIPPMPIYPAPPPANPQPYANFHNFAIYPPLEQHNQFMNPFGAAPAMYPNPPPPPEPHMWWPFDIPAVPAPMGGAEQGN